MNLTPKHIVELVLCRHYSDKYSHVSTFSISETLDELICEGLITVLKQHSDTVDVIISERGRQTLLEVGSACVIHMLLEADKEYLLSLCNDPLILADLPLLLVSSNEHVRALAQKLYRVWQQ